MNKQDMGVRRSVFSSRQFFKVALAFIAVVMLIMAYSENDFKKHFTITKPLVSQLSSYNLDTRSALIGFPETNIDNSSLNPEQASYDTLDTGQIVKHVNNTLPHWRDKYWCDVNCKTGVPCEYKDEVDFRILLLVANRPDSLAKSFDSLRRLHMMGDRLSVDIWIDMLKDGHVDNATEQMAKSLVADFDNGRACYHTQDQHAYIATQWIDCYRPKPDTHEVAIIVEDDIDLSPYVWKWYKALHEHFRDADYIAGYSLKSEAKLLRTPQHQNKPIAGPKNDTIVLYNCFQAWGYSPQPNVWRAFQDWYHTVRRDKAPNDKVNKIDSLNMKVNGSLHTSWWYSFKKKGFQESMAHEMYNIYYTNVVSEKPLYTVYQNLNVFAGKAVYLCKNRKEKGLHYGGEKHGMNTTNVLLNEWNERYIYFPEHPKRRKITGETVVY